MQWLKVRRGKGLKVSMIRGVKGKGLKVAQGKGLKVSITVCGACRQRWFWIQNPCFAFLNHDTHVYWCNGAMSHGIKGSRDQGFKG